MQVSITFFSNPPRGVSNIWKVTVLFPLAMMGLYDSGKKTWQENGSSMQRLICHISNDSILLFCLFMSDMDVWEWICPSFSDCSCSCIS